MSIFILDTLNLHLFILYTKKCLKYFDCFSHIHLFQFLLVFTFLK